MLINNPNLINFKTQAKIETSHADSEVVRYYGQEITLGALRNEFSSLDKLSNMSIFYDDTFQYTSLGLLDLVFEIKKINSPLPIKDFFNRGILGNDFVKTICSLWGISAKEVDEIEKKFYVEILRRSPLSKNAVPFLKLRKSLYSQTLISRYPIPNAHHLFNHIKDYYRAGDGNYVSLEFATTNGKSEKEYLSTVPKNKIERFEFTVAQDANSVIDFYEQNEYKGGTVMTGVKCNQLSDKRLYNCLSEVNTIYTVKFMEEGVA